MCDNNEKFEAKVDNVNDQDEAINSKLELVFKSISDVNTNTHSIQDREQ